jgi:hypothetical protein
MLLGMQLLRNMDASIGNIILTVVYLSVDNFNRLCYNESGI